MQCHPHSTVHHEIEIIAPKDLFGDEVLDELHGAHGEELRDGDVVPVGVLVFGLHGEVGVEGRCVVCSWMEGIGELACS